MEVKEDKNLNRNKNTNRAWHVYIKYSHTLVICAFRMDFKMDPISELLLQLCKIKHKPRD